MIKKRDKYLILISRRNLIVSTTEENPNKLFLFFKSRQEKPPTYDEVLGEEGSEWLQVTVRCRLFLLHTMRCLGPSWFQIIGRGRPWKKW